MTEWIEDTNEYWLPVPGFNGLYDVSTSGRVRSCDRLNVNIKGVTRLLAGKILATAIDSEGYRQISLFRNGHETKARVHRLVAQVFVKNPNKLPLVDHRNRQRSDNFVRNLRWVSPSGNRQNSVQNAMADMKRLAGVE